ncbi:MAG: sensor histidine kinase [Aerococcus sp.]|nr:sensor histidine kinase [Aerococcus sp.]
MHKQYWSLMWPFVVFSLVTLGIFALVFSLFDLDFQAYRLGAGLLLFILGIILVVRLSLFRQTVTVAEQLAQTKRQFQEQIERQHQQDQELHDYFLLWVHQMKTPITASALLLADIDTEVGDSLRLELTQIERYTNMALTYLKVKSTASDLHIQSHTLDEMIKPLINRYRLAFIRQHIQLHYTPITESVVTDANWSQLMIEQILNNAIKYAPHGEVWITYDATTQRLTIRDSGMGIRSSDLPKIFDKGYSGFNGELTQKASGIGLFLVQQIAKRLHQPVTVQSTWGAGSAFQIQFSKVDPLLLEE